MTTLAIRKKLISFIADADDKKVKGLYLLIEDEITGKEKLRLSAEQELFLDEERKKHISGKSKSFTWGEAKKIIRKKRTL